MSIEIVTDRNKLLEVSEPVKEISPEIRKICWNIEKVLNKHKNGAGISAIQLGYNKDIIGVKIQQAGFRPYIKILINPEITFAEDETLVKEGCLSFPGKFGLIKRFKKIEIDFRDFNFKYFQRQRIAGFSAMVIQHEVDHINGIICIDKFEKEEKNEDNKIQKKNNWKSFFEKVFKGR